MKRMTFTALWYEVFIFMAIACQIILYPSTAKSESKESPQTVQLGTVEVTGQQELAPYNQSIITSEEIEAQNAADTGDILRIIPGISAGRTGQLGLEPVLRGLKEDQLNVLIDGAKIWGACPGRMVPPSSQLDVDDLESIEIIRGPFSVRHGAGTLGGVINLISKQPKRYDKPEIHGALSMGYDDAARGNRGGLSLYGGDKPYDYRLFISGMDYDNYDSTSGEVDNSSFKKQGYSAKIGLNPVVDHRLELAIAQERGDDIHYPARLMDAEKTENMLSNIKYIRRDISPLFSLFTGSIYYNTAEHTMNNDDRDSVNSMEMQTKGEAETYGGRLESVFEPDKNSHLTAGVDYYNLLRDAERTRKMQSMMMSMIIEDKPWNNARIQDWGLYAEFKNRLIPELELTLAARLDLVKADSDIPNQDFLNSVERSDLEDNETNLSGNIGLVYSLNKHIDLSAGIGRGVRTADANERYSYYFPASKYTDHYDYLGNPDIKPEESLEFDIGARGEFDRAALGISLFYNRINNYITGETDPLLTPKTAGAAGVRRYVNVDAVLRGFEIDGSVKLTRGLSIKGNIAYTEGKNSEADTYLPQIPPLEGNLALRYDYSRWDAWSEVSGRFVAGQNKIDPDFGDSKTAGFSTFGIALGAIVIERCSLTVGADNLFDKEYAEHLNGEDVSTGEKLLEPGRNIFAKVKWEF